MRIPFEKLIEHVQALSDEDWNLPMGELAKRFDVSVERLSDAVTAVRVLHGERTYLS